MIQVNLVGQLANQAFGYITGKILAERLKQAYLPNGDWLDRAGNPLLWTVPQYLHQKSTHGRVLLGTPQTITGNHWLDIDSLDPNRPVKLAWGYWQRYELWNPYRYKIWSDWLAIKAPLPRIDPEAVYVHVRRGDYVRNQDGSPLDPRRQCVATTIEEYAACLERFPKRSRIVLVTDDPGDPFLLEFSRFGKVDKSLGTWDMDFLTLLAAKNLIISQSTFSWLAGFLGKASRIVCPLFPNTHWWYGKDLIGPPAPGEPDYPNLIVDDEPRWEWVTE